MIINILLIVIGFVLLIKGADLLVDGACNVAKKFKIPQIIVGLTIVSIGTSLPELMVSTKASIEGLSDVSIANVVGSNLCNLLLILGLSAILRPIDFEKETKYFDIPISIISGIAILVMGNRIFSDDNFISRVDGTILLVMFAMFIAYTIYMSKHNLESGAEITDNNEVKNVSIWISIVYILIGIIGLKFGGDFVVDNAVTISSALGISQKIISLTIIAIGTSLPELATSVMAAIKGNSQIAIGNVIGSNISNLLLIIGVSSLINPVTYETNFNLDILFLLVCTVLIYTFTVGEPKNKMTRGNGIIYAFLYIIYIATTLIR